MPGLATYFRFSNANLTSGQFWRAVFATTPGESTCLRSATASRLLMLGSRCCCRATPAPRPTTPRRLHRLAPSRHSTQACGAGRRDLATSMTSGNAISTHQQRHHRCNNFRSWTGRGMVRCQCITVSSPTAPCATATSAVFLWHVSRRCRPLVEDNRLENICSRGAGFGRQHRYSATDLRPAAIPEAVTARLYADPT